MTAGDGVVDGGAFARRGTWQRSLTDPEYRLRSKLPGAFAVAAADDGQSNLLGGTYQCDLI
jgi:hypothetical protein